MTVFLEHTKCTDLSKTLQGFFIFSSFKSVTFCFESKGLIPGISTVMIIAYHPTLLPPGLYVLHSSQAEPGLMSFEWLFYWTPVTAPSPHPLPVESRVILCFAPQSSPLSLVTLSLERESIP